MLTMPGAVTLYTNSHNLLYPGEMQSLMSEVGSLWGQWENLLVGAKVQCISSSRQGKTHLLRRSKQA